MKHKLLKEEAFEKLSLTYKKKARMKLTKLWLEKKNYGKIIFTPHNAFYSKEALHEIRYKALISLKNYFEKKD